jgi:hypothetical protein
VIVIIIFVPGFVIKGAIEDKINSRHTFTGYPHDPQGKVLLSPDFEELEIVENETHNNPGLADTPVSYIVFRTTFMGKSQRFMSEGIKKDPIALSLLLEKKRKLYLYVDRDNPENYFFDLTFLHGAG